jgi:diguanylate cyclase
MLIRENRFEWLIGLFALFAAAVYAFNLGGERGITILTNVIAVGGAALAFAAVLMVARRLDAGPSAPWRWLAGGLGLFLLGEISWGIQEAILGIDFPFPSIADLFWVAGYLPLFVGLMLAWRRLGVRLRHVEKIGLGIFAAALALAAAVFLLVPIGLGQSLSPLEKGLNIIYPLGDIVLLVPAAAMAVVLGGSLLGRAWRLIGLGFVLIGAADLAFSYLSWHNLYRESINQPGNLVDLVWLAGYLAIALAGFRYAKLIE